MTTTTANAYVQPLCAAYFENLCRSLERESLGSRLYMMVSNGGIASVDMVRNLPIRLLESGPAAGVIASSFYSRKSDLPNVIAFDMGGTTAKICLIKDGRPRRARSFEAARIQRFAKGSGLPIRIPVVELVEIGAGGGSIAHLDDMGLLKVGPESAGADPGPACYPSGGSLPTVTDADLMLGYLNPNYFLGGAIDWALATSLLQEMRKEGAGFLMPTGVAEEDLSFRYSLDMRYLGQGFEIEVDIDQLVLEARDTERLEAAFRDEYFRLFNRVMPSSDIEVLTWRVAIKASAQLSDVPAQESDSAPFEGSRRAFFPEVDDFLETQVLRRAGLRPNEEFVGPCIVEDVESTVVVGPSGRGRVLPDLGLLIEV